MGKGENETLKKIRKNNKDKVWGKGRSWNWETEREEAKWGNMDDEEKEEN